MAVDQEPGEYRQYRFRLPEGACDLLLVRHGESLPARDDAPFELFDGHADPALDPRGRDEAARVAERLEREDVSAIYVSSLRRTQETAAPLAQRLHLEPIVVHDLREVFLGEWEGGNFRRMVAQNGPIAQRLFTEERWDVIPGAEPADAFSARLRSALEGIARTHPDQRVAVFTHGGVIGSVISMATGARPFAFLAVDNGSITHVVITAERWIVRRFNDTGHLGTDLDRPPQPLT